jgi:hypothetical protein
MEEFHALRKREHKFHAKACVVDGIYFPSKRQANRYQVLSLLVKAGTITDLQIDNSQTTFRLEVNGQLVCKYRADAVYRENGERVVEDSKGYRTEAYLLKRKLMKACLGIEIREV